MDANQLQELAMRRIKDEDKQTVFLDMLAPKEKTRTSGLLPSEERALKAFALSDEYPRQITVERTGTVYRINGPEGARRLLKALRFGSEEYRWNLTEGKSKPKRRG